MAPPNRALQALKKKLEKQWVKVICRGVGADQVRLELGQDLTIVIVWRGKGPEQVLRHTISGKDMQDGVMRLKACQYAKGALQAALRYKGL